MPTGLQNRPPTDDDWYDSLREREAAHAQNNSSQREINELEKAYQQPAIADSERHTQPRRTGSKLKKFRGVLKGTRTKSPLLAILIILFGGGGVFTAIFAPGVALLSLADTLERDLNSQLSAMDQTSNQLWRAKLKQTTSGSCGKVVLRCKFKTINVEKFDKSLKLANSTATGRLSVDYDRSAGWGQNRGKIKAMTWTSPDGQKTQIDSAKKYADFMKSNVEFRKTMLKVYNPRFHAFKTKVAIDFLAKNKTSYAKKLVGKNQKEVRESKNKAIKGEASVGYKQPKPILDEEGKETGRFQDPDTGRELSPDEVQRLRDQESRLKTTPSTSKLLGGLAKGALITAYIDTACTVYNASRAVATGAKVLRSQELIRYSMVYINEAHAIRAEMATPETVQVASDDIMYIEPKNKVADETKLADTPNGQPLPMIDNPNAGKTGMDSPIYKMSSSQDYPRNLDASTQALMPGGGFGGTLAGINTAIAQALGSDNPKQLSERCKIVQNPFVRTSALVIGIAAGIGTFGASTAASIAGSTLIAMALPYLTSQLAGMAAGNVTADLKGISAVSAIAMGSGLMYNGMARSNGLMTMSPEKMASYQNRKRETLVSYDQIDQQAARTMPFDITNRFSFAGSLARASLPIASQLQSGGLGVVSSLGSLTSLASTTLLPKSSAADARQTLVRPERYTQCNDPDYKSLGRDIAVDPTCVMVFGLPDEAMNIDPEENLEWMLANDEIDPESEDGAAKDNGRDWNYKKYLEQCVTNQPGIAEDPEAEPTNGAGCASQANYQKNWHYAKFKLSIEANLGIDQDLPGMEGGSENSFGDGSTSAVGADGWAYPTDKSKIQQTSKFGPREGSNHKGADLAGPLGTPIYTARDGEVVFAGPMSGFGNLIVVRHTINGQRYDTAYGHMARSGVLVKRGDTVKAGQMIGRIGNEGRSSGPHLHFELWQGESGYTGGSGQAIDPQEALDKAESGGSGANNQERNV